MIVVFLFIYEWLQLFGEQKGCEIMPSDLLLNPFSNEREFIVMFKQPEVGSLILESLIFRICLKLYMLSDI